MNGLKRPAPLAPGDTVAVIAASGFAAPEIAENAEKGVKALGFNVIMGGSCYRKHGFYAGTDEERAADINAMFADKTVKGIFMMRGGYGTQRLMNMLDYDMIRENPKFFCGYSDVTAIHTAINQRCGFITFHGPMASVGYDTLDDYSMNYFRKCVFSAEPFGLLENPPEREIRILNGGKCLGMLTGGNLSLLVSSMGTPYEIDAAGKILLIEDVGEELYRIDRMLTQLRNGGKFHDCAGILLCDFHNCPPENAKKPASPSDSLTLEQIFEEVVLPAGKPTLYNIACGHCSPVLTLPLGANADMDADKKEILIH